MSRHIKNFFVGTLVAYLGLISFGVCLHLSVSFVFLEWLPFDPFVIRLFMVFAVIIGVCYAFLRADD